MRTYSDFGLCAAHNRWNLRCLRVPGFVLTLIMALNVVVFTGARAQCFGFNPGNPSGVGNFCVGTESLKLAAQTFHKDVAKLSCCAG